MVRFCTACALPTISLPLCVETEVASSSDCNLEHEAGAMQEVSWVAYDGGYFEYGKSRRDYIAYHGQWHRKLVTKSMHRSWAFILVRAYS